MKTDPVRMAVGPQPKHTSFAAGALALLLLAGSSLAAVAQAPSGGGSELQQKVADLKQASAANKQKLRQYQWVETRQITLKGSEKPQQVFQCSYGPDGKVQKTMLSAPPQQQQDSGRQRRVKEHVIEKKTEEMKDYMQQVQSLLSLYVPPNPDLIQQAMQKKNISLQPVGGGAVNIVFKDYAKPGDQMTITFDPTAHKMTNININTYMSEPKDVVTLAVTMGTLPDGTNYTQQTVLNATQKQIQVTMSNSNYTKL